MSRPSEVVVAILGATGSGKSSFINAAVGGAAAPVNVGHGLKSHTVDINPVRAVIDARECILIDTPGYDDTGRSDVEILRATADFLQICLEQGRPLTGVVYLHRITDNRVGGAAAKNFRMLAKVCGAGALRNVVLCTTMWDAVERALGEEREKELCAAFWQPMIAAGATVVRHDGSEASARAIVRRLVNRPPVVLQLQDELVNDKMQLSETEAGKEVGAELARFMEAHEREIGHLRRELERAQDRDRQAVRRDLKSEQDALRVRERELGFLLRSRDRELQELNRRAAQVQPGDFWSCIRDIVPHVAVWVPVVIGLVFAL